MDYNNKEDELFQKWASFLGVTMDEFVSDGLLFHAGLKFDALYAKTLLLTIKKKNAKSEIIIYLIFFIYIFHLIIIVCIL